MAQTPCRLALQLGLDVSGSVDSREYRLQLDGIATALLDPEVTLALLAIPDLPVALSIFEWSGQGARRLLLDWKMIRNETHIFEVADQLKRTTRGDMSVSTGLGNAMLYSAKRFSTAPACPRQVLDISGDGKNNDGPRPQDVHASLPEHMLVNALVIGPNLNGAVGARARETEDLVAYFRAYVLRGPEAFVEVAIGYEDYSDAMRRKLLKEIQVLTLSDFRPATRGPGE